jgi:hypothetical protein
MVCKKSAIPELSNFYCLPGRAGGLSYGLAESQELMAVR